MGSEDMATHCVSVTIDTRNSERLCMSRKVGPFVHIRLRPLVLSVNRLGKGFELPIFIPDID
jgi:hypothetical protein